MANNKHTAQRKPDGLEISESDLSDDQFDAYFKQFEEEESADESLEDNTSKWQIEDYQILHRKDAEFAFLTIVHTDQEENDAPLLFAFRAEDDDSGETQPLEVQNIHGADVLQCYLERGWDDITQSDSCPWVIKSWLAMRLKQDTI